MIPERIIILAATKGLDITKQGGGGRPEYVASDAALAAQGVEQHHFAALDYRWGRAESWRPLLFSKLMERAVELSHRESWPRRVLRFRDAEVGVYLTEHEAIQDVDPRRRLRWRHLTRAVIEGGSYYIVRRGVNDYLLIQRDADQERKPYIEDLVNLALREEHQWWFIRQARLEAAYMRVEQRVWDKVLRARYEAIRGELDTWCSIAASAMRPRLRTAEA